MRLADLPKCGGEGQTHAAEGVQKTDEALNGYSIIRSRSQQPPKFPVPGCLTALLEIIRKIHLCCLLVDRAPDLRVEMRQLTLDIQAFAVGI